MSSADYPTIHTTDDGHVKVIHDQREIGGTIVALALTDSEIWLSKQDIPGVVQALTSVLPKSEAPQPSVPLASEVSFEEALFRLAAAHGKLVTFRYEKARNVVPATRRLVPQHVQKVGDHLTFTGYDPDRDDVRAYRLDRVRGDVQIQGDA